MQLGIIGAGRIGGNAASLLAAAGHRVLRPGGGPWEICGVRHNQSRSTVRSALPDNPAAAWVRAPPALVMWSGWRRAVLGWSECHDSGQDQAAADESAQRHALVQEQGREDGG